MTDPQHDPIPRRPTGTGEARLLPSLDLVAWRARERAATDWRSLYPFRSHFHALNDGRGPQLHYVDEGPRDGHAIVCVHGNPTWSFYYRALIAELSADHRVVALDHIGCGLSDKPDDARYRYTLDQRVADLTALIDALALTRVTLVVHDWGGMIGMAWAARHLDRVARVVAMNTAAFGLPTTKPFPWTLSLARTPLISDVLMRGASAFTRGANRWCATRHPLPAAVARGYAAPYDTWANRIAVHRFVQDIPLRPQDPAASIVAETAARLGDFARVPMAIFWGMRDFIFDAHFLRTWERRCPHAEIRTFDDAGHYVLDDAQGEILTGVREFFMRHRAER